MSATPSVGRKNRMSMGGEEMFNQEREMDLASGMLEQGRKIGEANFERRYDTVEMEYDGRVGHGDKRSGGTQAIGRWMGLRSCDVTLDMHRGEESDGINRRLSCPPREWNENS